MKQFLRYTCVVMTAAIVLAAVAASLFTTRAQSTAPLNPVDGFVAQLTASAGNSFVGGISADGRFVVVESTGDIATDRTPDVVANNVITTRGRNNADGNREIFLVDYAQRRVFQITDTRSVRNDRTQAFSAAATTGNLRIEISNTRPTISADGRFIAFTSNALLNDDPATSPALFDGETTNFDTALATDANQEIFLYRIPNAPAANLTSGVAAAVELGNGTFTRVTNTAASARPRPGVVGSSTVAAAVPFVADDNRNPSLNDDGNLVAFTSTRDLVAGGNIGGANSNPEVFTFNRTIGVYTQITTTPFSTPPTGSTSLNPIFNENPVLSGDGRTLAFVSNAANLIDTVRGTANNADANAEVFLARLADAGAPSVLRQVTQTQSAATGGVVLNINTFSPGKRLSRRGDFLAFESTARFASPGDTTIEATSALFLVDVSNLSVTDFTFTQVGLRNVTVNNTTIPDVPRFPTFVGTATATEALVFTSAFNFRSNGGTPDTTDTGLNPASANGGGSVQVYAAPVTTLTTTPAASLPANTFVRLTNFAGVGDAPRAFPSSTRNRIAFSIGSVPGVTSNTELGGGNADRSTEAFYLLTQARADATPLPSPAPGSVSFFLKPSDRGVATATASPTPTPSPAPADTPAPGVAAGEFIAARPNTAGVALAPTGTVTISCTGDSTPCASEARRRPTLPIELNGVSVAVGGAAAGLYTVSPGQIDFVVPVGLTPNLYEVVINNNGTLIRSLIRVVAAQPDIVTSTNGAGGRAAATNVTNPLLAMGTPEPFTVTTTYTPAGATETTTAPTRLRFMVTGLRGATDATITVRIGTTAITGDANIDSTATDTPGIDQLDVVLSATLAGAGDVPVIVEVANNGTFTSRPAESAPRITIR